MALLSAEERGQLRDRAIAFWEQAKALNQAAALLSSDAQALRSEAAALRRVRFRDDNAAVLRVDQILEGRFLGGPIRADGFGFALASRIHRIGALHEGLHRRFPVVWTARDPASALGITIMNQPDVALVDDELPIMSGLEAIGLLTNYAPETRFVLFTSDERAEAEAKRKGIPIGSPDGSLEKIVSVIDGALAA